jgi:hypothetical protein
MQQMHVVFTLTGIHLKRAGDTEFIRYDNNNGFTGEKIQQAK